MERDSHQALTAEISSKERTKFIWNPVFLVIKRSSMPKPPIFMPLSCSAAIGLSYATVWLLCRAGAWVPGWPLKHQRDSLETVTSMSNAFAYIAMWVRTTTHEMLQRKEVKWCVNGLAGWSYYILKKDEGKSVQFTSFPADKCNLETL